MTQDADKNGSDVAGLVADTQVLLDNCMYEDVDVQANIEAAMRNVHHLAALQRLSQGGEVGVKPLTWREVIPGRWRAGIYMVDRVYLDDYNWYVLEDGMLKVRAGQLSLDQAKAAAQADYERRTLCARPTVGVTDEMVEAAYEASQEFYRKFPYGKRDIMLRTALEAALAVPAQEVAE